MYKQQGILGVSTLTRLGLGAGRAMGRPTLAGVALAALLLTLQGCGQKGPLYLDAATASQPATGGTPESTTIRPTER